MEIFYINYIKRYLNNFFRIFLFVPAITFGTVNAGVFPYAFLYSLINIKAWANKKNIFFVSFIFTILLSALISCFILGRENSLTQYNLIEIIRSTFSIINGPIVLMALLSLGIKEIRTIERTIFVLFPLFIVIAILQYYNFFITPSLFRFFIPSADNYNLVSIDRGVTILQSEPARSAFDLVYMAILIKMALIKRYENFHFLFDICLLVLIYVLNKSLTGLIFVIVFIICFNDFKSFIKLILSIIFLFFFLLNFEGFIVESSRIFNLIEIAFNNPLGISKFIYDSSGFRIIAILSVIPEIIKYPFGVSVGLWREHQSLINLVEISQYMKDSGISAVKIPSFIFEIIYSFGIFCFLPFTLLYKGAKKIFMVLPVNYLFFFFFGFIFSDTVGDPIPWISLALLYRTHRYEAK